jgi:hypothetical protein
MPKIARVCSLPDHDDTVDEDVGGGDGDTEDEKVGKSDEVT